jgi:membrane protein DedA with SNARE-associated domain
MPPEFEKYLALVTGVPIELAYMVLAAGAAVENLFPPIPSDTFVIIGGLLTERGVLSGSIVLASVWASNVITAVLLYLMARRYGQGVFATSWGRWLLRPHQLETVAGFYSRYGLVAIFGSRFLPMLRVVVPAFAGIARLGFFSATIPLALASAVWYTALLYAGIFASRNLERLFALFGAVSNSLLGFALLFIVLAVFWWLRSRRHRHEIEALDEHLSKRGHVREREAAEGHAEGQVHED